MQPTQQLVRLLLQTVSLLGQILSWEFKEGVSDGRLTAAIKQQISPPLNIFPGPGWNPLLVESGLFGVCCKIVRKLNNLDFNVNTKQIRNCMIQLLSLKGSIFGNNQCKLQYFDLVTTQLCGLMREAGDVNDEVIDFCQMLSKIIRTLELEDLANLQCLGQFLHTMHDLSVALLASIPLDPNAMNTHASEAFDVCVTMTT